MPEFVKADHGDEIAFVFGKPFLAGNVSMITKVFFLKHYYSFYLLEGFRIDFLP